VAAGGTQSVPRTSRSRPADAAAMSAARRGRPFSQEIKRNTKGAAALGLFSTNYRNHSLV